MGDEMKIVIVTNGFVYVGRVDLEPDYCVIREARNIRRYGTTRGLGQLALEGPTPQTVLDPVGTVYVPLHALVSLYDTGDGLWRS